MCARNALTQRLFKGQLPQNELKSQAKMPCKNMILLLKKDTFQRA